MFPDHVSLSGHPRRRGSALIITLSALVLITAAVLIYFDQSILNRQIAFSSAGQYRADVVAHTGLDTIVGDLRTEIVAGSSDKGAGTSTHVYVPNVPGSGGIANATMVPCRVLDQGFANLVKQSASGNKFWSGANYNPAVIAPVRSAASNNTATSSTNGRYIQKNRWNKPGLLTDPAPSPTPALPANYQTPDWVIVTRQGAVADAVNNPPAISQLSDRNSQTFAVGRYAYTIYNEGGLIDVNVAGFPTSLQSSPFSTRRGLLPQVDLTNVPGVINAMGADNLVKWRNQATYSSYANYVSKATNGFTSVASGDQAFVSRRDLINYVQANPTQVSTAALPFLGTSSLDTDQPSYYPDPTYQQNNPNTSDTINPNVMLYQVKTPFTRADGTQAVIGEPLVKHRFPLSRLDLFTNPDANLLKTYFCMQQAGDGLWDYIDPDTHKLMTTLPVIKSLQDVANTTPGREPTFWELLQAGVYTASLGQELPTSQGCQTGQNSSPVRQIFALGLSIIDQYKADNNPTTLRFGGPFSALPSGTGVQDTCISGVNNVPYFAWFAENIFRDTTMPASTAVDGYLLFALWNPHRNANSAPAGSFRIITCGETYLAAGNSLGTPPTPTKVSKTIVHNYPPTNPPSSVLAFHTTSAHAFSNIDVLRVSDVDQGSCTADMLFPYGSAKPLEVGLFAGTVDIPLTVSLDHNNPGGQNPQMAYVFTAPPVTFVLEKLVGSNWIPYQVVPYFSASSGNNGDRFNDITSQMNAGVFTPTGSPASMIIDVVHSDPRTSRFGYYLAGSTPVIYTLENSYNLVFSKNSPSAISGYSVSGTITPTFSSPTYIPADYAYNQSSYSSTYKDRDLLIRKGDSNTKTALHLADSPYYYSANNGTPGNACPVMLNRRFTSVAEMGYAFRDDPWRTLNFSSQDSADGGLLDLFCLNENKNANRAGVVDLNGASTQVLQAILTNAYQDPTASGDNPMTATQANTIATAMRSDLVLGHPGSPKMVLRNVSDLPLLIDKVSSAAAMSPNPFEYKYNREALARSFADVTNTRTWNLLIDVVAQSGRYAPTAKSLNDFAVEGERRYWVHLALDRVTGKVLRTQTEPITE